MTLLKFMLSYCTVGLQCVSHSSYEFAKCVCIFCLAFFCGHVLCLVWGVVCFSVCVQCSFQMSACTVSDMSVCSSDFANRGNGSGFLFTV